MTFQRFSNFLNDESGAVTVDWVVLTAAIVGIAMAVIALISSGISSASNGVNGGLGSAGGMGAAIASTITESGDAGFTAVSQNIYDDGYNYTSSSPDQFSAYLLSRDNYLRTPTADNLDWLAGSEQSLVEGGFELGPEFTTAAEYQQTGGPT